MVETVFICASHLLAVCSLRSMSLVPINNSAISCSILWIFFVSNFLRFPFCFGVLQMWLKWFFREHSLQMLPYAGHFLGSYISTSRAFFLLFPCVLDIRLSDCWLGSRDFVHGHFCFFMQHFHMSFALFFKSVTYASMVSFGPCALVKNICLRCVMFFLGSQYSLNFSLSTSTSSSKSMVLNTFIASSPATWRNVAHFVTLLCNASCNKIQVKLLNPHSPVFLRNTNC